MAHLAFVTLLLFLYVRVTDGFLERIWCNLGLHHAASSSSLSYGHFVGEKASEINKEYSFVQNDMRKAAMMLHTRDQAPKEGQQKAQTPFTKWEPTRSDYMQFLVDSLEVYQALEDIIEIKPELTMNFKSTGLERVASIRESLDWMISYDNELAIPDCGHAGKTYAQFLKSLADESVPKFMCHYYNHYFAHTAGGRMIGKKMGDTLLGGEVLSFYKWQGDVKTFLDETRKKIDAMAATWTEVEKKECLEETLNTFKYGSSLMSYLRDPALN